MDSGADLGRSASPNHADIWVILGRSVSAEGDTAAEPQTDDPKDKKKRPWESLKWRLWLVFCDCAAALLWMFGLVKLFAVDIDRILVEAAVPSATWLLDYRLIAIPVFAAVVAGLFWRRWTLFFLVYVAAFPVIVVFWKIPAFMVKRRSWTLFMVALNTIANIIRDVRFFLLAGSLAVISAFLIVVATEDYLLVLAALCLAVVFLWSLVHVTVDTFRPSWFLDVHKRAIDGILSFTKSITTPPESVLAKPSDAVLNMAEVTDVVTKMQWTVAVNRGMYFWAYRLQQYRQLQLGLLFNSLAYGSLFVASVLTFGLLNLALLKVDSGQFEYDTYPSSLAMFVYGLSTLVLSDGGGVAARDDVAYLLRFFAGLFGVCFLGIFAVNLFFTWRRDREDSELKDTVRTLRVRARQHEAEFRAWVRVDIEETIRRLTQLGQTGILLFVDRFTGSMPSDFFEEGDEDGIA